MHNTQQKLEFMKMISNPGYETTRHMEKLFKF